MDKPSLKSHLPKSLASVSVRLTSLSPLSLLLDAAFSFLCALHLLDSGVYYLHRISKKVKH